MALIESEGRLIQNLIHFSTTTLVSGLLVAIFPLIVLAQEENTPLDSIPILPTAAKTLQEAGWTDQAITPIPAQLSQTSTPETPEESSSQETQPEIRYFTPRIGAVFVSGPEVGYPSSVAGLEGFLPLIQTGEQNLTFLEGRFLLSTNEESNLRGNFIIGHRFYTDQRIYGAYLGYDIRDTQFNQFNQLGLGLETLGDLWDAHFNVYVPLGNTQQQTGENVTTVNTITQSVTADSIGFQKNFLVFQNVLLQQQQQQQITRSYENALFGLDFDIGAKILQIGNQGDLRGFVGGYYYEGQQIRDDIWGWRLGLEVKPTDTLRLGISVQDDDTFGTNVIVRLGANFPGTRPRNTSVEEVWARMGEWVHRQEQIVIDEVQTTQTIFSPVEVSSIPFIVAINPTTNQPWIFRHVNLGQGGGDGTFENPFGTVDGAIAIAQNNEIVYVQSGTNPGIPSFRVPDGVQVLSTGPQQIIPTANRGNVILPLSNSGILPTVNGTITMGSNSVLSGFDITANNSGVRAIGVNNFVVRDNIIRGINGSSALLLTNASNGLITNNQIIGVGGPALVGTNISNIRFPNNTLTSSNSTSDGIRLDQINNSIDFTGATITINNAKNRGIAITNSNGSVNFPQVTITQATGGTAVEVTGGSSSVNVTGNINNTGGRLLRVSNTTGGTVNLNGSQTNTNGTGILVENGSGTVKVDNASIQNAQNNGVEVNNFQGTVNLSNFNIANPGGRGIIAVGVPNGQTNVNVNNSTITNTKNAAIESTNTNLTVNAVGISGSGGDGIKVSNNDAINHTVAINNSQISNGNAQGININKGTITAFANNRINNITGNGINLAQVTFDADPNTAGFQAVSGGTTTVNQVGNNGILLTNVSGALTTDTTWNISNITNNGLEASGTGNLTIGNINVNNVPNANVGIDFFNLNGSFTVAGNTNIGLNGAVGTGIRILNSNVTYSFSNGKTVNIINTTGSGILTSGGSSNGIFGDVTITNSANTGITIGGNSPVVINKVTIDGTIGDGIFSGGGNTITINGGSIKGTTGSGINSVSSNLTVDNVVFTDIGGNGINITNTSGSRNISLTNNDISANNVNVVNISVSGAATSRVCLVFNNNKVNNPNTPLIPNDGTVRFIRVNPATFNVQDLTNISTNNQFKSPLVTVGTINNVASCP